MGKKRFAKLDHIEYDHNIKYEAIGEFIYTLQSGLLLSLKEENVLTEMQYRHAAEKLKRQHRERIIRERGAKNNQSC